MQFDEARRHEFAEQNRQQKEQQEEGEQREQGGGVHAMSPCRDAGSIAAASAVPKCPVRGTTLFETARFDLSANPLPQERPTPLRERDRRHKRVCRRVLDVTIWWKGDTVGVGAGPRRRTEKRSRMR